MPDEAALVVPTAPADYPMTAQEARDITVLNLNLQNLQAQFNAVGTAAAKRLNLPTDKGMRFDIERCVWLAQAGPTALPRADDAKP